MPTHIPQSTVLELEPHQIILRPLVTEKGMHRSTRYNAYAFEINRLATRFGARARVMRLPRREGLPNAVIASWGELELELLDEDVGVAMAKEASAGDGLLVDYLGDLRRSAELGLPLFRLSGGAGYLWSATSDETGRGHLRFLAKHHGVRSAERARRLLRVALVARGRVFRGERGAMYRDAASWLGTGDVPHLLER